MNPHVEITGLVVLESNTTIATLFRNMKKQEINDILVFLERSKALQSTYRYRSSLRDHRNSVAEHSWRLALMTLIIGKVCKLKIDMGHALSLALIHDLAEAEMGDIDAYEQIQKGRQFVEAKAVAEVSAMRALIQDLSFGGYVLELWKEYEDKNTLEAKFVDALDGIEGFLHIAEDGVEAYIPKEFHATYVDEAVAAFDGAIKHFPELTDLLDVIKKDLKTQFEKVGVAWVDDTKETSTTIKQ